MKDIFNKKIGVLGGGQLGRMLQEIALSYGVDLYFLEQGKNTPCSIFRYYHEGDIKDEQDVYEFGKQLDSITIEIEHVSTEGMKKLEKDGVLTFPHSDVLDMIKNKRWQKEFYIKNNIPTAHFTTSASPIDEKESLIKWLPLVQKSETGGYDGKGVAVINTEEDFSKLIDAPSIIESKIDIKKELATTIAIDQHGKTHIFPICEMIFDPELNLVDYILSPAEIDDNTTKTVYEIAEKLGTSIQKPGLYSIEFFLTLSDDILVNEMAPRAHNSAHYTIEGTSISQFEVQLRILLDLPIPIIQMKGYASMINLIGEHGYQGSPKINGMEEIASTADAHLHWYGKSETKPGRKMGHITIVDTDKKKLVEKTKHLKSTVNIISNES